MADSLRPRVHEFRYSQAKAIEDVDPRKAKAQQDMVQFIAEGDRPVTIVFDYFIPIEKRVRANKRQ
jgi:hypothetical protein